MMEYQNIGVMNEVTIVKPDFEFIVSRMIEASYKKGLLNLQLLGLKEIPMQVQKMKGLKRLKLDHNRGIQLYNKKTDQLEFPPLMCKKLTYLSINQCDIVKLPENIYVLERIKAFHLVANHLESIPQGIIELHTLETLDFSKVGNKHEHTKNVYLPPCSYFFF